MQDVWPQLLWNEVDRTIQWSVVIFATFVAALIDVRMRRVPNWLTGSTLGVGLVWAIIYGGAVGLFDSLIGCIILALPYVLLFMFAGGGAGDAKLMGAVGAWLGIVNGTIALGAVALAGVCLAVGVAVCSSNWRKVYKNMRVIGLALMSLRHRHVKFADLNDILPEKDTMQTMPYAIAIFAGVCIAAGGVSLWPV